MTRIKRPVSTWNWLSGCPKSEPIALEWRYSILTNTRTGTAAQTNPIVLDKGIDIPRKPKAPEPIPSEHANGISGPEPTIGKRKRDADEAGLVNGQPRAKRIAALAEGDGSHPIVLDDEEGTILLD